MVNAGPPNTETPRQMSSRVHDVIVVGDFRFAGGTSTAIASELRAQTAAGYRTALLQVACPILRHPHPMHAEIRALVDGGAVEQLDPEAPHEARLLIAHHPALFLYPPRRRLQLTAPTRILVAHHPPRTARGVAYYDPVTVDANAAELLGGKVLWAPVGPAVRAQLEQPAGRLHLWNADWCNIIDAEAWACAREEPLGIRPVIGRHSRPGREKWPATRADVLAAYPADPMIRVRILGAGPILQEIVGSYPANWEVLPFNAQAPAEFLREIDFFVYYHHPDWVEAFGRNILEAMASGAVIILPEAFRPTFDDAALYAAPGEVAGIVKRLHADAEAWRRQSERGRDAARARFGPARHVERIAAFIGHPGRAPAASGRGADIPVLFLTSNGVGMGHLTRALAMARRCPPPLKPVFATMSQGLSVVREFGFLAEYIPFHAYLDCDIETWNGFLHQELSEILSFHDPRVVVFDGNVPYEGLLRTIADNPERWFLWSRRAMWRAGSGGEHIDRESFFDAVIEPAEIAGAFDRGLTANSRRRTRSVAPICLYDTGEMLGRDDARKALGLDPDKLAVLVHLGAGNNYAFSGIRQLLLDRLSLRPSVQVAVAEWLISEGDLILPEGALRLRRYPLAPYLGAFDFAVGAAGYNSFHEAVAAALPTIFVPNENPMMDDQLARASYAERRGLGLCLRARDVYQMDRTLASMLDQERRAAIAEACRMSEFKNGAIEAAQFLAELALSRRADRAI